MEWTEYKVIRPKKGERISDTYQELTTVSHIGHLETAIRILKDKQIRAGLIRDESKLKKDRLQITWLSPNSWYNGSRYGSIVFNFNFKDIYHKKLNCYWVEVITKYNPHAPRFLITDSNKYNGKRKPYDPATENGPWIYDEDTDKSFGNGKYTLEFMFECDFPLRKVSTLSTIKHHREYCSMNDPECEEHKESREKINSRFIAGIIANNIPISDHLVTGENKKGI